MKREFTITAKDGPKMHRIMFVRCKVRSESVSVFCLCCRQLLLYPSAWVCVMFIPLLGYESNRTQYQVRKT